MQRRAAEIVEQEGAYPTDQFLNTDAHDGYEQIGVEVTEQLDGDLDAFCTYIGVGGCFIGTVRGMTRRWPDLHRVAVEPAESAVLSGEPPGTHRIEGGGVGFRAAAPRARHVRRGAGRLDRRRVRDGAPRGPRGGRLDGPSGGANLVVALRLAERLGAGHRVVTIQPDSGLKYLAGDVYRNG